MAMESISLAKSLEENDKNSLSLLSALLSAAGEEVEDEEETWEASKG